MLDHYKAVLIVGSDHNIPDDIRKQFSQEGYLLIGDGVKALNELNYRALQGKIGDNTIINIITHGGAEGGKHYTEVMDERFTTDKFLRKLTKDTLGVKLNIELYTCFAGAASPYTTELPEGSVMVAHSPADNFIIIGLSFKSLHESTKNLSPTTSQVDDFLQRFALHVKQTATFSIKKPDGSIFQHTVRPPDGIVIEPENIVSHLEAERKKFIDEYNKKCGTSIEASTLKAISLDEAIEWRNDYFLYQIAAKDDKLVKALNESPDKFTDKHVNCLLNGNTALAIAAFKGYDQQVSALLKVPDIKVDAIDKYGRTALMGAAGKGHADILSILLKSGKADANAKDKSGMTALMLASLEGHLNAVITLLKSGKIDANSLNATDNYGNSALSLAIAKGDENVIQALLDASIKNDKGFSAFMLAAQKGHTEVMSALHATGEINVNAIDNGQRTALILAAINGRVEAVSYLLGHDKVDVSATDQGTKALMGAIKHGHPGVVATMLESDKVFAIDYNDSISLVLAALKGDVEKVSTLLTGGNIDSTAEDKTRNTALLLAAKAGHATVISVLLKDTHIDVNAKDEEGNTALLLAARAGHAEVVAALLGDARTDVTVHDGQKYTPLMWAVMNGNVDVISILLRSDRVDVTAKDSQGKTALIWALEQGNPDVIITMLELSQVNRDSINEKNRNGLTKLMVAANKGDAEVVSAILQSDKIKEDVLTAKDRNDNTALILAIMKGHKHVVDAIIASGKIVPANDLPNKDGKTALMLALELNHDDIALTLIHAGIGINTPDKEGTIPFKKAAAQNKLSIIDALVRADLGQMDYAVTNNIQIDNKAPILYALKHAIEIDGIEPMKYAIKQSIQINNQEPILYAITSNTPIDTQDPLKYAVHQGITINGEDPTLYADRRSPQVTIEGLSPIAYAAKHSATYDIKINGEDPILYAVNNRLQIEGEDPIIYAIKNKIQIEYEDAMTYAVFHKIPVNGKDAIRYAVDSHLKGKTYNIGGLLPTQYTHIEPRDDPISFAYGAGLTINGMDPIKYAIKSKILIEKMDPVEWEKTQKAKSQAPTTTPPPPFKAPPPPVSGPPTKPPPPPVPTIPQPEPVLGEPKASSVSIHTTAKHPPFIASGAPNKPPPPPAISHVDALKRDHSGEKENFTNNVTRHKPTDELIHNKPHASHADAEATKKSTETTNKALE